MPDEFARAGLQSKLDAANLEVAKTGAESARRAEFEADVAAGNRAAASRRWDEAVRQYEAARAASPEDFRKQNLQTRLDEASRTRTALAVAAPVAAAGDRLIRDGLVALMTGDSKKAASLLEQAQSEAAKSPPQTRAAIGAYLAVAYASQALATGDNALEQKARGQYRQAQQLRPDFRLDDRIVSPQIKKMLTGTD
jgi:hypothetical protein